VLLGLPNCDFSFFLGASIALMASHPLTSCLQTRHPLRCLLRRYDWMDLKFNQIPPILRPLIKKRPIRCFHELVASRQVLVDPTRHVRKAIGRHATAFLEPAIYGCGCTVAEVLDYHKQGHAGPPKIK
jgi:hypothetical protein